jgi:beta-glucanase (GH16 family)
MNKSAFISKLTQLFISFTLLFHIFLPAACSKAPSQTKDGMWSLVWNDEFNGFSINSDKWTYDLGNGFYNQLEYIPGWGNDEKQFYTDSDSNSYIKSGSLHITAIKGPHKGVVDGTVEKFNYTSARLKTDGLFSKKYGRFEIRAKLPVGKGLWPAIWMMPQNNEYGAWAASGEIDIMEARGSDFLKVYGTIHYGGVWPENRYSGGFFEFPFTDPPQDTSTWHIYSLEWEPGELRWYVDGKLYQTKNMWNSEDNPYPAPFDKEFYLLMNLAVGGSYDGESDETTSFPATMKIDYVRVYELTGREYRKPVKPDPRDYMEARPSEARPAGEDGNEVYNNNFTVSTGGDKKIDGLSGSAYWYFLHLDAFGGDGNISLEKIDGKNFAKIEIKEQGSQFYSVQLIQNVPLVKGHTYEASFIAKASEDRSIMVKISGDETRDWATYSPVSVFKLSKELKTYKFNFTMAEDSDLKARFEFNVGTALPSVWIGDVWLKDISPR